MIVSVGIFIPGILITGVGAGLVGVGFLIVFAGVCCVLPDVAGAAFCFALSLAGLMSMAGICLSAPWSIECPDVAPA